MRQVRERAVLPAGPCTGVRAAAATACLRAGACRGAAADFGR